MNVHSDFFMEDGEAFEETSKYCGIVNKLTYFSITRPDMLFVLQVNLYKSCRLRVGGLP